jgi:hypothetical protein
MRDHPWSGGFSGERLGLSGSDVANLHGAEAGTEPLTEGEVAGLVEAAEAAATEAGFPVDTAGLCGLAAFGLRTEEPPKP